MTEQLTFDLPVRTALGRADYFVSAANEAAVAVITNWADWPGGKMALCGAKGAGKTHLVHVWAAEAQATVMSASELQETDIAGLASATARIAVEDVEQIAGDADKERALLHLHNLVLADGGRLLLTGLGPPARWPLVLPDLASRMQGTGLAQLQPPDDRLLCAVLVKLFADRQIVVAPGVVQYLAARVERSFDAAGRMVAALDAAALAQGGAITQKLATRVVGKMTAGDT